MGLNFNYLLYFEKDRIWDVLQALARILGFRWGL